MLADKVKQRRKELGLTQEELAHKMGSSPVAPITQKSRRIAWFCGFSLILRAFSGIPFRRKNALFVGKMT